VAYFVSTDEHDFLRDNGFADCEPFVARTDEANETRYKHIISPEEEFRRVGNSFSNVAKASLWGYSGDGTQGILDGKSEALYRVALPKYLMRHGDAAFSRAYIMYQYALLSATGLSRTETKDRLVKLVEAITIELREFAGFMRWAVTVLAMLNEVPVRTKLNQPPGQYTTRFSNKKYLDYHTVTLSLPKTKPLSYLERRLGVHRKHRRHEVRSHWRTYLPDDRPYCRREEHDWEYDHPNGYRLCGRCMAASSFIPEHERGDASLGWVRKDYVIKKQQGE
jgi:hypothetical protein